MNFVNEINSKKQEINRLTNDLNVTKNNNLVNKTKLEQYKQERINIINELNAKGYSHENLGSTIEQKINEMNNLLQQASAILYKQDFGVKDDVSIPTNNVDIPTKDFKF